MPPRYPEPGLEEAAKWDSPIQILGKLGRGRVKRRMEIGAVAVMSSVMASSCDYESDTASRSIPWLGPDKS